MNVLFPGLVGLFFLILSAGLAFAELGVFRLGPAELRQLGDLHPRALDRISRLRADPASFGFSVWLWNAVAQVGLALSLAAWFRLAGMESWIGLTGWILIGWVLFGILLLPEWIARPYALRCIRYISAPLTGLVRVSHPVGRAWQLGFDRLWKWMGVAGPRTLTEEEFLTGVDVGGRQGVLGSEIQNMVRGILDIEQTQASEVMTPRVDLVGISAEAPATDWVEVARSVRFRHLPVYRGSMDSIEGMLDVVRFLLDPSRDRDAHVARPLLVSETALLDDLLRIFQQGGIRSAIVLDEYGGTAGLITRGDILEEITADVSGEYAPETPSIQALGDGSWLVDGRVSLEDLNEALGVRLSAQESDRIAGWALEHAGKLLKTGDRVETQDCRATVRRTRKHRLLQLQIERLPSGSTVFSSEMGAGS